MITSITADLNSIPSDSWDIKNSLRSSISQDYKVSSRISMKKNSVTCDMSSDSISHAIVSDLASPSTIQDIIRSVP